MRFNPTKSQASVAGSDSDADVTVCDSAQNRVHVDHFICAFKAVKVPVLVCLGSSCNHVTEGGGPQGL